MSLCCCTLTAIARASAIVAPTEQLARRSSPTPRPNSALLRCSEPKRHKRSAELSLSERRGPATHPRHPSSGSKNPPEIIQIAHPPQPQDTLLIDDEAREPDIRQLASGGRVHSSRALLGCAVLIFDQEALRVSACLPHMPRLSPSESSYYIKASPSLVPQPNRLLMRRLLRRLTIDCPGAWRVQTKAHIVTLNDQLFSRGTTGLGTLVLLLRERSSLRTASSGSNTNNV